MPVVKRSTATTVLPSRTAQVLEETDVLVVGGGPAGLGAAVGAAQAGAKVTLAEQYGFLGGHATAALLVNFASYHCSSAKADKPSDFVIFPSDHGEGEPLVAGVLEQLVKRLAAEGGALLPSKETGYTVPFDPEIFKLVLFEMLEEANVSLLLHAFASGTLQDSRGQGVVFETKSGPVLAKAKNIVDCTGDGDVAASLGAPFEVGRKKDGLTQPMTLMLMMEGFQKKAFEGYVRQHPEEWNGVQGLQCLIEEAKKNGDLKPPREDILFFGTMHEGKVNVNSTRITKKLGIDVWDLTFAEIEARKQISMLARFLCKYVPGFEEAYIGQTATTIGARETRRIVGEYMLTKEDILQARMFPDVIAHCAYPIDIHNPAGKGTTLIRLRPGEFYDIPLRCLIPLKVENLLVAGRCISGTHEATASIRIMPTCVATGQAAGICAAIASRNNRTPREVPTKEVQLELLKQGATLQLDPTSCTLESSEIAKYHTCKCRRKIIEKTA